MLTSYGTIPYVCAIGPWHLNSPLSLLSLYLSPSLSLSSPLSLSFIGTSGCPVRLSVWPALGQPLLVGDKMTKEGGVVATTGGRAKD